MAKAKAKAQTRTRTRTQIQSVRLPLVLAVLLAPQAQAAWRVTPMVDLRETYTDNFNLARDELARNQFVHEITPGLIVANNGPRLKLNGVFQRQYFAFSDNEIVGRERAATQMQGSLASELIDNFLYLDGSASIGQQSISAFAPQVNGNNYSNVNRAEVKTWRLSPYLRHRFGSSATGQLSYQRDSVEAGNSGLGNTDSDSVQASLYSGSSFRKFTWNAQLNRQHLTDSLAPTSTVQTAALNLRRQVTGTLGLTASGGYDDYDYQSLGGRTKGAFYTLGFAWTPSARTSLTASAGKRYYGTTYSLQALHRSRHTVWNIVYNDAVTTTRAQFLLPAAIDTAAMLNRLFTADIPDPAARQRAVDAYIVSAGLPPSLNDNINYFSNRYILQKQLQGSVAFNTARSTLILSLFDVRRNALSATETDSKLQGPGQFNMNDNTEQRGASALANWRINSRSTVNLALTSAHITSKTTNTSSDNRVLRLGMTRQFQSRLLGTIDLRHVVGTSADMVNNYSENALTASLTMKF